MIPRDNPADRHLQFRRVLVVGLIGLIAVALVGLTTGPVTATSLLVPELEATSECDAPIDTVSVAGQSQLVREDHAMLFAGAEILHTDSAIAGYPAPEQHAQLFAGATAESVTVDSAIAGYPAPEEHAKVFAGVDSEHTDEAASADCPPA